MYNPRILNLSTSINASEHTALNVVLIVIILLLNKQPGSL